MTQLGERGAEGAGHQGDEALLRRAEEWAGRDPDPQTQAELRELIATARGTGPEAAGALEEIADAFSGRLEFGTAGLRAKLGAGPNRMNRVVVRRAAAGLADFLNDSAGGSYRPRAVIGFDARHNSEVFAAETAAIFTARGIDAMLMPSALPTPVLAFAVRNLDADAGVMVTASHNPPQDNGYKVYLGGRAVPAAGRGAQIVPPFDQEIADRIYSEQNAGDIELAPSGWDVLPTDYPQTYESAIRGLAMPSAFGARDLKIVMTPMHGVGGRIAQDVLGGAGFKDITMVAAQEEPDPDFPTVAFPNPEEPGALDLAMELAREVGADIIIANDPDADRAAVAVPDPGAGGAGENTWRMLRGDEVGSLLGAHMLARRDAAGAWPADETSGGAEATFANSIVSSRQLAAIGQGAGMPTRQTLTGFKWISRVPGLVYGYEEALGYCVAPDLVKDKDGISAALLIAEMAATAKAEGKTLNDLLDEIALRDGLYATDQLSIRVQELALIQDMMERARTAPPTELAGEKVTAVIDLADGSEGLPPTDGMEYLTEAGSRVIIRPSGTEPKLKCYLEVTARPDAAALSSAREHARGRLETMKTELRALLGAPTG